MNVKGEIMCFEIMVFAEDPVHVCHLCFQHHAKTLDVIKVYIIYNCITLHVVGLNTIFIQTSCTIYCTCRGITILPMIHCTSSYIVHWKQTRQFELPVIYMCNIDQYCALKFHTSYAILGPFFKGHHFEGGPPLCFEAPIWPRLLPWRFGWPNDRQPEPWFGTSNEKWKVIYGVM